MILSEMFHSCLLRKISLATEEKMRHDGEVFLSSVLEVCSHDFSRAWGFPTRLALHIWSWETRNSFQATNSDRLPEGSSNLRQCSSFSEYKEIRFSVMKAFI